MRVERYIMIGLAILIVILLLGVVAEKSMEQSGSQDNQYDPLQRQNESRS